MLRTELTEDELRRLMRPVRGEGGWQSLLRQLQRSVVATTLTLSERDVARIRRSRENYGDGGWQGRLPFLRRVSLDTAA